MGIFATILHKRKRRVEMAKVRRRVRNGVEEKWIADYFDQYKKRHIKTFARKRDAEMWLAEARIEVKKRVHTPEHKSITVAEAAELWIERAEKIEKLETATVRQYRNHVRLHINPRIGAAKLSDLSTRDVEKFKDQLLIAGSRVMAGKVLTSLKGILSEAMRLGEVAQNVAAAVRLGQKTRDKAWLEIGREVPSKNQLREILAAVEDTRWHPLLATAAMAGLRSSELRGLRWVDLDLDDATLRVRQRADEKNQIGPPKSAAGTREIPLSPWLFNILRRWRLVCPRRNGELDLVFPNGLGKVENHANAANRGLYDAQRRIGMVDNTGSPMFGMHSLRHFFASVMIDVGYQAKRLQEAMGHSTLAMTMDRYGHLFPAAEDERAKMAKAAEFLVATKSA
jgi:integrase